MTPVNVIILVHEEIIIISRLSHYPESIFQ